MNSNLTFLPVDLAAGALDDFWPLEAQGVGFVGFGAHLVYFGERAIPEKFVLGEEEFELKAHRIPGIRILDFDVLQVTDDRLVMLLKHLGQRVHLSTMG